MNLNTPTEAELQPSSIDEALSNFAASSAEERGAVFTRKEVVNFILDLTGYTVDADLASARLLEPAAGLGDFLLPVIDRLVRSFLNHGGTLKGARNALADAILAFEVHEESLGEARRVVASALVEQGLAAKDAHALAKRWVVAGDFLLSELPHGFTHIVGNPPYVRQEMIPENLLDLYRSRFKTMYDRADLYIPFFERSLEALVPAGKLGFICTDRWTKNKYGGPLRSLIAHKYALTHYVDLVGTRAFLTEVMTYPAITVIERSIKRHKKTSTRIAIRPDLNKKSLSNLARQMTASRLSGKSNVFALPGVVDGSEPWIVHDPARLALVRRLEGELPLLEETGCKVGIGVATGNDRVYIAPFDELDVEPSRKLPLVRTHDCHGGEVRWRGMAVLNPFEDNGKLADLAAYPKFAAYLKRHANDIKARNVAKRNPDRWYRTIDRIYPHLASEPKLLVPDIKGDAHIVYEAGKYYPHHNLYYITAKEWDLRALQAVLMSGIARLFVATYSTSMRGGFLRFQAQYLRRIRLPEWKNISADLKKALCEAALTNDREAANHATCQAYGLSKTEQLIVGST